jgi:hypothetical protein
MKPPSPNAEPLGDQYAAQVRAPHGLFVAADEFRDLERCHHAIRQSARRERRIRRWLRRVRSMRRSGVRRLPHRYPFARLWASDVRRRMFAMANRVEMVRREDDHLRRSARVADSVRRDSGRKALTRISADGRRRCVADVRDASYAPDARCPATCPGRNRAQRRVDGYRPSVVSPRCGGQWVGRSEVAVALSASPTCLRPSDLRLRLANRSGLGCFSPWALGRGPQSSST